MAYSINGNSFSKRKLITINNNSGGALTDFEVMISVTYETAMQTDFDDIRFAYPNGTSIYFWRESKTDSTSAIFWVNVNLPNNGVSPTGDNFIYMYYGNVSLTDGSDGSNTFLYYNDATSTTNWSGSGLSILSGKVRFLDNSAGAPVAALTHGITLPDDVRLESKFNMVSTTSENYCGHGAGDGTDLSKRFGELVLAQTPNDYHEQDLTVIASPLVRDAYKIHRVNVIKSLGKTSLAVINLDRSVYGSLGNRAYSVGSPVTFNNIFFFGGSTGRFCDIRMDWFIIRNYTGTEPTVSVGEEQHSRRGAIIIF